MAAGAKARVIIIQAHRDMQLCLCVMRYIRTFNYYYYYNKTWHALNSTFLDNNCIVYFQIKLHWTSNSGLDEGSPVFPGQCSCTLVCGSMAAVCDCGFELIDHLPYSPDLAPSDYFLFPNINNYCAGET